MKKVSQQKMKLLAFVDMHGDIKAMTNLASKAPDVDMILCAGDISRFENNLSHILARFDKLNKPMLIIHGNHESASTLKSAAERFNNIHFMHKEAKIFNNVLFMGFGGGGFDRNTPEIEEFFKKHQKLLEKAERTIFLTHAPPYKTKLDQINGSNNGNNTTRNMIIRHQPYIVVCGHFHENWNKLDILGNTKIINPGPSGAILTFPSR